MAFFFTANIVWKSFILETKLSKSPSWQSIWNFWLVSKMSFPLETSQIQLQPGVIWFSWSQILWMKGLACVEKNEFPCFLKICRNLGDQVGCSLHLLHCRLFCDKSESQKRVKIWMIQNIRDYCVEEGQQVTCKKIANATEIVAVQTKNVNNFESGATVSIRKPNW